MLELLAPFVERSACQDIVSACMTGRGRNAFGLSHWRGRERPSTIGLPTSGSASHAHDSMRCPLIVLTNVDALKYFLIEQG